MDEPSDRVRADHPKQPQHDEQNNDCLEHVLTNLQRSRGAKHMQEFA
jgi:hypothetical protein